MTSAKMIRNVFTGARVRIRAPSSDPEQHAQHDGHGQARVDVAAAEVDAGAGGGGDADHEVAGRRGHLERDAHGLVHGQHLEGARADAEQPRQDAGHEHQPEARRHAVDVIRLRPLRRGVAAVQTKPARQRVGTCPRSVLVARPARQVGGDEQHDAEDDGDDAWADDRPPGRPPPGRRRWWRSPATCRCGCWSSLRGRRRRRPRRTWR